MDYFITIFFVEFLLIGLCLIISMDFLTKIHSQYIILFYNIIIVSSAASNVKGAPNRFIYGTTKAALNGFVKAIAADYVKDGIRCNAILPGTVETPSWESRVSMADDPKKARIDFINRQAMGRLAKPEEIASLGVYLASEESDFVTGTLNLIDGGWTL